MLRSPVILVHFANDTNRQSTWCYSQGYVSLILVPSRELLIRLMPAFVPFLGPGEKIFLATFSTETELLAINMPRSLINHCIGLYPLSLLGIRYEWSWGPNIGSLKVIQQCSFQVESYGGNLTIHQKFGGNGAPLDLANVIMVGNGVALHWKDPNQSRWTPDEKMVSGP